MTGAPQVVSEEALFFDSPQGNLMGVVTRPARPTDLPGVLLCPGGWYGTSTNRNQVVVRLARHLADRGHTVLRFDWHGVGESGGSIERFQLDAPFADDVIAASGRLAAEGVSAQIMVGVCFGSRSAFTAAQVLPAVTGLALISFPVPVPELKAEFKARRLRTGRLARMAFRRSVLAGLFDRDMRRMYRKGLRLKAQSLLRRLGAAPPPDLTRLDPTAVVDGLHTLRERAVPVYFLFGEEDLQLRAFHEFRAGPLGRFLDQPDSGVEVATAPGDMSAFGTLAAQEAAITAITDWIGGGARSAALP